MRDLKSRRGGGISRRCENTGMRLSVEHVFLRDLSRKFYYRVYYLYPRENWWQI